MVRVSLVSVYQLCRYIAPRPKCPSRNFCGSSRLDLRHGHGERSSTEAAALQFYATCHPGLEETVAEELRNPRIGAQDVEAGKAGVSFSGSGLETGYRANLWLRSAIRVLLLLAQGYVDERRSGYDEIYRCFRQAARWEHLLLPSQTFRVDARVSSCTSISSSAIVSTRGRDAVCDALRDATGLRPAPPAQGEEVDLPLFVTLYCDYMNIYRDMSGRSLHRRSYRDTMHRASLNEAAAAGLLLLAGWHHLAAQPGAVMADPMCGSGTLAIEAALVATASAPGLMRRRWPFQAWPDFEDDVWQRCRQEAVLARRPWEGLILANDVHRGAVDLAIRDARAAGVGDVISFHEGPCGQWQPELPPQLVVTNPPWGLRLMPAHDASGVPVPPHSLDGEPSSQQLEDAWKELGVFLKTQCPNAVAHVLSGNSVVTRHLRMKTEQKHQLTIGGVDCRLLRYKVLPPKLAAGPPAARLRVQSPLLRGLGALQSSLRLVRLSHFLRLVQEKRESDI